MKEEQESSRQATQESAAGQTRTTAEKVGRIQGGVEAKANFEGALSSTALPAWYFLHDLVMGGTSYNGSRQVIVWISTNYFWNSYTEVKDPEQPTQYWCVEDKSQKIDITWPQNLLQNFSNQRSMILLKK